MGKTMGNPGKGGRNQTYLPVSALGPKFKLDLRSGSADTERVDSTEQPFKIDAQPELVKQMKGIPAHDQRRIRDRIKALATDPRPHGVEKLSAVEGWRIRMGDYRIVYRIDDTARVVIITRVAQRGSVYRRR